MVRASPRSQVIEQSDIVFTDRERVSNLAGSQCAYLTEHPYGRLVGVVTDLPAIASSKACET